MEQFLKISCNHHKRWFRSCPIKKPSRGTIWCVVFSSFQRPPIRPKRKIAVSQPNQRGNKSLSYPSCMSSNKNHQIASKELKKTWTKRGNDNKHVIPLQKHVEHFYPLISLSKRDFLQSKNNRPTELYSYKP